MDKLGAYNVHPVADLFPLIEGDAFDELVRDIKANGLLEPITLTHDGSTLVDGRNRYQACVEGQVDPVFVRLGPHYDEAAIIAVILAKNLQRRHLDTGQRAMIGMKLLPFYEAAAKERQRASGGDLRNRKAVVQNSAQRESRSGDEAARAVGVSHASIDQAKVIANVSPSLAARVQAGTIALNAAHKEARAKAAAAPKPERPPNAIAAPILQLPTHDGQLVPYRRPQGKPKFNRTNEQVDWAAWTWNPVTGCLHNCPYCYSRELAHLPSYAEAYPVQFTPLFHEERLEAPAHTIVPGEAETDARLGRVFVCSMGDLYGKWVPREWIEKIHASCIANPQWQYLMLTKFPQRYLEFEAPPTAWFGTSVDRQHRVKIAETAFRQITNVAVRWLSLEPMLEELKFSDLSMFDWIVIGSQTATEQPDGPVPAFAPPFKWVARIVVQAYEARVPVYLKPNLLGRVDPQSPGMQLPREEPIVRTGPSREDKGRQLRLISA